MGEGVDLEAEWRRWTASYRSRTGDRQPFLDASGGRVHDFGSRDGGDGAGSWDRKGGEEVEIVGFKTRRRR